MALAVKLVVPAPRRRPRRSAFLTTALGAALAIAFCVCVPLALAQERSETPSEETVASLATGRVVIAVVKGAIIIGTLENPIEVDTRPPTPVLLSSVRVGIILGAVRWSSPSTQQEFAQLDRELPRLRSHLINIPQNAPHLAEVQGGTEAGDIELVGQGLLERLNEVAQNIHAKVDMPEGDPLAELILVDYFPNYGPEAWQLSYAVKQEEQQQGYWITRVLRPGYLQFWPPEKGQPRTLVEFAYPPDSAQPPLLELLRQKDPRIQKIVASDPKMTDVAAHFLQGETSKMLPVDATQFLRAALDAIAPPNARETMAIINAETGFEWILPPPAEPIKPGQQPARLPGAPTLNPQ